MTEGQRLRWERGTRYYEVYLHQDLWGEWVLTCVWGRRGTALGQIVHTPFSSYDGALEELGEIKTRREQRGYRVKAVVNEGQSPLKRMKERR